MIKILFYLFTIKFRKIVSKDDYLAISILLLIYISTAIIAHLNYDSINIYLYVLLIDIVIQHVNRKDLEFLKLNKNYKVILFFEYLIYLMPFCVVFLLQQDFVIFFEFFIFIIMLINFPKIHFKTISYPFQLFNPFWHINFRKYRVLLFSPLFFMLIYIGVKNSNDNIFYFSLFILCIISCIPSFERERTHEIIISPFSAKKYLFNQLKNSLINTLYLMLPMVIVLCALLKWEMVFFLLGLFNFTLINILFKYVYFSNKFLHQISFVVFVCLTLVLFGIPLILSPLLYQKSIKNLNTIKYANY
jgi:hypothetical protein